LIQIHEMLKWRATKVTPRVKLCLTIEDPLGNHKRIWNEDFKFSSSFPGIPMDKVILNDIGTTYVLMDILPRLCFGAITMEQYSQYRFWINLTIVEVWNDLTINKICYFKCLLNNCFGSSVSCVALTYSSFWFYDLDWLRLDPLQHSNKQRKIVEIFYAFWIASVTYWECYTVWHLCLDYTSEMNPVPYNRSYCFTYPSKLLSRELWCPAPWLHE